MRVPGLTSPPPSHSHSHHYHHHHHPHSHHHQHYPNQVRPVLLATPTTPPRMTSTNSSPATSGSTSSATPTSTPSSTNSSSVAPQLSEQHIFSPGALVEVQTVHSETITGVVLAFEYDNKLLILKSESSNKQLNTSNVTVVNLDFCSKVNILAEPNPQDLEAEIEQNTKLPDLDIKKLEDRFRNAAQERHFLIQAYKTGAGVEGVSLFAKLQKTFGENPGISWDSDSIIIGKHVRIAPPFKADSITIRANAPNDKVTQTSLDYTKQVVEKYWRDQHKDPYTQVSVSQSNNNNIATTTTGGGSPQAVSVPQQQQHSKGVSGSGSHQQHSQPSPKSHHQQQNQQQQHNKSNSSNRGGYNKGGQHTQHHNHHYHSNHQQQHSDHHHGGVDRGSRNASVSSTGGGGGGGGSTTSGSSSTASSYASLASASVNQKDNSKKSIAAVVAGTPAAPSSTGAPQTAARS